MRSKEFEIKMQVLLAMLFDGILGTVMHVDMEYLKEKRNQGTNLLVIETLRLQ